jgi:hypothetical protein
MKPEERNEAGHFVVDRLGEGGRALALRPRCCCQRFRVQSRQRIDALIELGDGGRLTWKRHRPQRRQGALECRHDGVARIPQLRAFGGVRPVRQHHAHGAGAIRAEVVQRLEYVGGHIGNRGDPVGGADPLPGIPGAERQDDHQTRAKDQNDGFQKRVDRNAVEHVLSPKAARFFAAAVLVGEW